MICQNSILQKSKFEILIHLVFLIFPIFLIGKNSDQDSTTDQSIKSELEILFEKMKDLNSENMDSCLLLYEKALVISGDNKKLEAETNLNMARVLFGNNQFKEAFKYTNKSLKIGEQINDNDLLYDIYVYLGGIHWSLSNLPEALNSDLKALEIGEQLNNENYIARSTLNLGLTYSDINEYEKAYNYFLKAKGLFKKIDDFYGQAIVTNNQCRLLLDQEKYEEALQFIVKEFPNINTNGNRHLDCIMLSNHGIALLGNNKKEGFSKLEKSYADAEALDDGRALAGIALDLSKWYLEFGFYDKALEITEKGIKVGEKYGIIKERPELYLNLSTIYQFNKKYEESLFCLEKSNQYKDELFEKQKEKEILGMDIMNLLKQEEMENELLQLRNFYQCIFASFLIVLFMFSIPFFYFFFRRKQRKQIQKFKQKVAADLHDDIGGNLSSISRIAKVIKNQTNSSEVNEMVEELVKKSDQSLRDIGDAVWAFDEEESQLKSLIDKIEDIIYSVDFQKSDFKIEYVKNIENENQFLSMEVRHHLLMIFKEAIHNIQKHTISDFVKLNILESGNLLQILIYNEFQTLKSGSHSTGKGLENMEKRIQEIGGELKLEKSINYFSIQISLKI